MASVRPFFRTSLLTASAHPSLFTARCSVLGFGLSEACDCCSPWLSSSCNFHGIGFSVSCLPFPQVSCLSGALCFITQWLRSWLVGCLKGCEMARDPPSHCQGICGGSVEKCAKEEAFPRGRGKRGMCVARSRPVSCCWFLHMQDAAVMGITLRWGFSSWFCW